ncbi:cytochrome c biogenesis protein ResB [Streptomyces katsurahamanus]|uniref:Cytochrome c biogenesis protein ResB n=1 Tax=Streptomyces katsurahamanus TaxID=2577098 RepID=A0ABW9NYB2_9ACTN|nr:cytochrome c biogenesis protein ResB [Streptomyces katsurahamanus]MQS38268.1 cytochrome c biogenesis protein ResB [Streptomyces katsurahamanus]
MSTTETSGTAGTGETRAGTAQAETETGTEAASAQAGNEAGAAQADTGAASAETGSSLSTAPREELTGGPVLGVIGWARWFWRQLTSMRVALILLLMLALAAVPGSLIPQNSVDDLKVRAWQEKNESWTPLFEKLQLFDVYSSVWFSAIYILLFVSLIGCIVPRTWQFVGQLRSRPPAAPGRLGRMPAYTTWRTEAAPEEVREAALALLKRRRFRAHTVGNAVSAEKGYLREVGNLIFHVALIVMLVAFAVGQLFKSEGGKLIVEGDGFSNTLTHYDDFRSGSLYDTDDLVPFTFMLDEFTGTYETNGPQRGTPRTFEAAVTWSQPGGKDQKSVIEVNKPLVVDGTKVYLLAHGYAPVVTVRDGKGKVVFNGAVPLLPIDANITSQGSIKVMDGYRDKNGKKTQLGFKAFFVPTFAGHGNGNMFSTFPAPDFPVLALTGYTGSLGVDSGLPQNVYQLDTTEMKQFKDEKGDPLAERLLQGETMKLPDGAGSITFEKEIKEWASFQISQSPGNGWALAGAVAAVAGLVGSLFIQRRRVWVRAVRGDDGVTVVEMAGLGRSESPKLPEELADLALTLHERTPTAPEPPAISGPPAAPEPPAASGPPNDSDDRSDPVEVSAEGAEK